MSYLEKIGIESDIVLLVATSPGVVRAQFRIDNSERRTEEERFPEGDWLDVRISARVYDPKDTQAESPLAEGPEERATARTAWGVIDLLLPPMPDRVPAGPYSVVAKVFSADDRYRKLFDPSKCRFSLVPFT